MKKTFTREDLLRRVGNPAQLAGARRLQFADGPAKGLRATEVHTASGLRFTVLEDRGLDLYDFSYKGLNLSFLSKNGPVSGERFSASPGAFAHVMNGGMLFTAGLSNAGGECTDDGGVYHPTHGRASGAAAEDVYARTVPGDGCPAVEVGGKMRETSLFGENLLLCRRITAFSSRPSVLIEDTLENRAPEPAEIMLLYHINLGYPFLDEGVRLYTAPGRVTPRTREAAAAIAEHELMTAPADGFYEQVFLHELTPDAAGDGAAIAVNEALSLGFYVKYRMDNLPVLVEWKSMRSGDYALGLEPSNNYIRGRAQERKGGTLRTVGGFGTLSYRVELGVLDGPEEIAAFRDALGKVGGAG